VLSDILKKRILVLDGGMGTLIQSYKLTEADFRADVFKNHPRVLSGFNDVLSITQPHIISTIHETYLNAGADIIETNTFNANSISAVEYNMQDYIYEMNFNAARLAKDAARKFTLLNPLKPRFVAGSVGPTSKTLSISPDINRPEYRNITFDILADAYYKQIEALFDGGVDIILIETIFDTLNAKAAIYATNKLFKNKNSTLPVMISGTITDKSGRNLSGQTPEAFLTSFEHVPLLSFGFNCSFGADDLKPFVAQLSRISPFNVCVYPNAGLPNELGSYDETPEQMAQIIRYYCENNWLNIVGGCCGTTPAHIELFSNLVKSYEPRIPAIKSNNLKLSGLESFSFSKTSNFINIGERTNVTGSRKFAQTIKQNDYKQAVDIAKNQLINGAQVIDICMDDAMIDGVACMKTFLNYLASEPDIAAIPVMIDSSDWNIIMAGLKTFQGKAIVNSISLKDGEEAFLNKAQHIKEMGAALVVMCFDEEGQADAFERKIEIAKRAYDLLTLKINFPPQDIIIDPNVLAIGTGIVEHNNHALDFINAVSWIKNNLPNVNISGGISNLSFAFRGHESIRAALHAVFLFHAVKAGMNMGIVNPAQLIIYSDIPDELLKFSEDIVLNRNNKATDNLIDYINKNKNFEIKKETSEDAWLKLNTHERLKYALVHGIDKYIENDVRDALKEINDPVRLIEGPLMEAMNKVGNLFGEGKMFLPQVVKTARVMKQAVNILFPNDEEDKEYNTHKKGKVLIATVKGDVHDIGKNIVAVVLSCNNVEVIDLGVMVNAEKIAEEALKNNVDIIALSGLITPSLFEMNYVVEILEKNNINIPVLVGGAATSKIFTAVKMAPLYSGTVIYVKDASMAANAVAQLMSENRNAYLKKIDDENILVRNKYNEEKSNKKLISISEARNKAKNYKRVGTLNIIPAFTGIKQIKDVPWNDVLNRINWTSFFSLWKIKGHLKDILTAPDKGSEATKLYNDALHIIKQLFTQEAFHSDVICAIYPAYSLGDDIILQIENEEVKLYMLRNQNDDEQNYLCLSDFLTPKNENIKDYLGVFLISFQIDEKKLKPDDDYTKIMFRFLSDCIVEALSQWLFDEFMNTYCGKPISELYALKAFGIRPAVGYPSYPDHSEKEKIFKILQAAKYSQVQLTENFSMKPASSVCGLYFPNKNARYFNVGIVDDDQIIDYAARKNKTPEYIKKYLSTNIYV